MLNNAKMRNNGDGTVTFEFRMDADDTTEVAVLEKFMSDYDTCIKVLREKFGEDLYDCELCGKKSETLTVTYRFPDGSFDGPHRFCSDCYFKMKEKKDEAFKN